YTDPSTGALALSLINVFSSFPECASVEDVQRECVSFLQDFCQSFVMDGAIIPVSDTENDRAFAHAASILIASLGIPVILVPEEALTKENWMNIVVDGLARPGFGQAPVADVFDEAGSKSLTSSKGSVESIGQEEEEEEVCDSLCKAKVVAGVVVGVIAIGVLAALRMRRKRRV
ncbi:hypothetical protein KIPB_012237, partial [Kipferlia bialata]